MNTINLFNLKNTAIINGGFENRVILIDFASRAKNEPQQSKKLQYSVPCWFYIFVAGGVVKPEFLVKVETSGILKAKHICLM